MSLYTEIFEQPEVLTRLLITQRDTVQAIARDLRHRETDYVFLAARGTSDNAGRYANYLGGAANHLPVALATPSLFTFYHQPPRLSRALVLGISQSGQSPDIVGVLEDGHRQGCPTLAITNCPDSPLAKTADYVLEIRAGSERAVAATKTYTAELLALAMLSAAFAEDESAWDDLNQVPAWVTQTLQQDDQISAAAERYRYMQQCVVLGRGFNYATAFEWALKLKELTYVSAEPYSSADFLHGPIAMVERGFPVMAIAPAGQVFAPQMELLHHLKDDLLAELVIISNDESALQMGKSAFRIPAAAPEALTPIVSIPAGQLFAYHLTRAKGYDTEQPRTIRKVTETR
ncbi:MAG TPA: SIS domain-containing protein [Anaerolineaceae bacterium]|nr:SIS domain-containing protein [Anaerolineaceae bacterium]